MTDGEERATTEAHGLDTQVGHLETRITRLAQDLQDLRYEYEEAGGQLVERVNDDADAIHQMRSEAEGLLRLIRGASLFGQYADDAASHRKQANRWRRTAVTFLIAAGGAEVFLAVALTSPSWLQMGLPAVLLGLLFAYASAESNNHRRTELDRHRIFLRMAAIESYTKGDGSERSRDDLDLLLYKFIDRHFIEPDLDSNAVKSVAFGALGPWSLRIPSRRSARTVKADPACGGRCRGCSPESSDHAK